MFSYFPEVSANFRIFRLSAGVKNQQSAGVFSLSFHYTCLCQIQNAFLIFSGNRNMTASESTARQMRRKDRELSEDEAFDIVENTPHAVIATTDASGTPYAVQITPVLSGDVIYFHTSADPNGRRTQNLLQNPKVSLCYTGYSSIAHEDVPRNFSVNYASAVVAGHASLVTDEDERKRAAFAIMQHHTPEASPEDMEKYYVMMNQGIAIWKVSIDAISGKARNKQKFFSKI